VTVQAIQTVQAARAEKRAKEKPLDVGHKS
jgi:hypothetical protein